MYTNLIVKHPKGDLVYEKAMDNFLKLFYSDALLICEEYGAWLEVTDTGVMFKGTTKRCRKKLRELYPKEGLTRIDRSLFLPGG